MEAAPSFHHHHPFFNHSPPISSPKPYNLFLVRSSSIFRRRLCHSNIRAPRGNPSIPALFAQNRATPCISRDLFGSKSRRQDDAVVVVRSSHRIDGADNVVTPDSSLEFGRVLAKRGVVLAVLVCGAWLAGVMRALAAEGAVYEAIGQTRLLLTSAWPKLAHCLRVFREQGLVLAVLLGLSAFFSMAETSITTLWPWKVRELAEKESDNGVFKMLCGDVTRFLTTILIGTTVVNIGATALVTEAATTIFGEAGVSAATGVMTVCGHAALAVILWNRAKSIDFQSKTAITSCYMFIWKLFYAEYFLIPLVR